MYTILYDSNFLKSKLKKKIIGKTEKLSNLKLTTASRKLNAIKNNN